MRYRMLETIHEYAVERAAETPEALREAADAHTAYYRDLVRRAEPSIRSGEQLPWIGRLEAELDNIRAVLRRTTTPPTADEVAATELALYMGWFWWLRNYRTEGAAWGRAVAELSPTPPATVTRATGHGSTSTCSASSCSPTPTPARASTAPPCKDRLVRLRQAFEAGEAPRRPASRGCSGPSPPSTPTRPA